VRHLASLGYDEDRLSKPRRLLNLCGLLTLALNNADAVTRGQFGTAAAEAIGPILLICWTDVGPCYRCFVTGVQGSIARVTTGSALGHARDGRPVLA
jgi:hypothetical protein